MRKVILELSHFVGRFNTERAINSESFDFVLHYRPRALFHFTQKSTYTLSRNLSNSDLEKGLSPYTSSYLLLVQINQLKEHTYIPPPRHRYKLLEIITTTYLTLLSNQIPFQYFFRRFFNIIY